MDLGTKIRELRSAKNMTQKDLADKLMVTAQAVSRWEQNEVEPSIDTLKRMSAIFNISVDRMLSHDYVPLPVDTPPAQPIIIQAQQSIDQRRTIGVCETCNRPILEGEKIFRHRYRVGRTAHNKILCETCEIERVKRHKEAQVANNKRARIKGLILATLFGGPLFYLSFSGLLSSQFTMDTFLVSLAFSYSIFAFFYTYHAKNNFIHNAFWEITSFGFVRMPGVIFSFDIDGLLFLIFAKVALFFIGIGIAVVAGFISLLICLALGMIVFPFSIINSFVRPDLYREF